MVTGNDPDAACVTMAEVERLTERGCSAVMATEPANEKPDGFAETMRALRAAVDPDIHLGY